jgi:predicted dehydrogenase
MIVADPPVRFGLLGYGKGARYFHAPLVSSARGCALMGVVTTSDERRSFVAQDHPGAPCFESLRALRDAGAEAVAISTPAATHSALTDEALGLGLHVVCDKPFALDADAAARSRDRALEAGLLLSPYQNRRWDSDFRTVQRLVDDGVLGTVTQFESRFERFAPDRGPKPAGGGTLLDFGSHLVDQALVLLGPVDHVFAHARRRDDGELDDVFVVLRHHGGATAHLWHSWSEHAPGPRFRVTGTVGTYVVEGPMDCQEAALIGGESPATLGDRWGVEDEASWGVLHRRDGHERVPSLPGAWPSFYEQFALAVRGRGAVPVSAQDAVESMQVLDAARRSAALGEVEHLT